MGLGTKIIGILVLVILLMFGGFYWYYSNTQAKMKKDASTITLLQVTVEQQKAVQKQMRDDINKQVALRSALAQTVQQTQNDVDAMRRKFSVKNPVTGKPSTLGKVAVENTTLVEKAINKGAEDQMRCFELQTGSPLTKEELNGTTTNTICPDLYTKH